MRLDTTSAGSLAEGGPSELPTTLGRRLIPESVTPIGAIVGRLITAVTFAALLLAIPLSRRRP
jgi:hypothetical protein